MRLVEVPSGQLWLIDPEHHVKCSVCTEWFFRGAFTSGYCNVCWRHYQRWRYAMVRLEKINGYRITTDATLRTFREKYMSGLLASYNMLPWTWPGETEIPPGALT